MKSKYEFIEHHKSLPINVFVFEKADEYASWHKEIELLFVAQGNAVVYVKNEAYTLRSQDVLLVNSHTLHRIADVAQGTVILSLVIDPHFFEVYYEGFSKLHFECNSSVAHVMDKSHVFIRKQLIKMMLRFLTTTPHYQFELLSDASELITYLLTNFNRGVSNTNGLSDEHLHQRFERILDYLNKHYDKKITLADLAKQEYISTYYLSRLFSEHLGIGFVKYINTLRLNRSMYDLINTNKNLMEIAISHGFSSAKAYRDSFKEKYEMTPTEYRKRIGTKEDAPLDILATPVSHIELMLLLTSLQYEGENIDQHPAIYEIKICDTVPQDKQWNTLEKILHFTYAVDEVKVNWQDSLKKIHDEIQFDYIRFSGIFNKGMYFYDEDEGTYNWFNVDSILDFFVSINIKPFIKLKYNEQDFTIPEWHQMLGHFIRHCIKRYGYASVREWKFEFSHSDRSYSKMIELYTKSIDHFSAEFQKLQFGIEFYPADNFHEQHFLKHFFNKPLSFISVVLTEEVYEKLKGFVKVLFNTIQSKMRAKIYFIKTEKANYLYDTCYAANKLIHNTLHEHHGVSAPVSFIDQAKSAALFHGEPSLLTYSGLKKPVYNAFALLDKLKGYVLSQGTYHYAVKNQDTIRILLFTELNPEEVLERVKYYKKHKIPKEVKRSVVNVNVQLPNGNYKLKSYELNRTNGSIFDEWIRMGQPITFDHEELEFLKSKEFMRLTSSVVEVEGELQLQHLIAENEIILLEIKKL
ncbi:GH39 family glycosyl hydrolase [Sporosarcina sp. UB5]|uniref:GH39 family glycosyl hydrolase n=1 Tax=Sporosarcina sp. UB5 TaxID=3047463 RepID=UPI003D7A5AC4